MRAGFVARVEKWQAFEADWAALLADKRYARYLEERRGKKYVHARKMKGWPQPLRAGFYYDANLLLRRTVAFGFATIIKYSDYERVFRNYPLTRKDSIYGLSFRSIIVGVCWRACEDFEGAPVAFVLEKGDPNEGASRSIFEATVKDGQLLEEAKLKYPVTTLTIADKEDWGALQVSDLHAYGFLKHLQSPFGHKKGKESERYFGDINLLMNGVMHLEYKMSEDDIRTQRISVIKAVQHRKEYGKRKTNGTH